MGLRPSDTSHRPIHYSSMQQLLNIPQTGAHMANDYLIRQSLGSQTTSTKERWGWAGGWVKNSESFNATKNHTRALNNCLLHKKRVSVCVPIPQAPSTSQYTNRLRGR